MNHVLYIAGAVLGRVLGHISRGRRDQAVTDQHGPAATPPSPTLDPERLAAARLARDQRRAELGRRWDTFTGMVEPQTYTPPLAVRPAEPATALDMERWRDWWAEWPPPGAELDELTNQLRDWLLEHPELVEHIRREPTRLVRREDLETDQ